MMLVRTWTFRLTHHTSCIQFLAIATIRADLATAQPVWAPADLALLLVLLLCVLVLLVLLLSSSAVLVQLSLHS